MFTSALRIGVFATALGLFASSTTLADDPKADDKKGELKVGDKAPGFCLRDDQDRPWKSADHFGKKWVVIYFYPGDFTPGCTAQANAFKDAMIKLAEQGVEVIGVSGDLVDTHAKFKKAEQLNFALLSDGHGTVARKFGVPFGKGATVKVKAKTPDKEGFEFERPGTAGRWTFVIGPDGTVAYKNTKVTPADAKAVSEFIAAADKK
jgi:thioredoxin-dependent peroxiredoxin